MMTADKIKELIGSIHGVSLIEDFIIDEAGSLKGRIAVVTDQEHADLEWYVEISPTYPFKTISMEPIHFQNKSLYNRKNEKCIFEKRKVHFFVISAISCLTV